MLTWNEHALRTGTVTMTQLQPVGTHLHTIEGESLMKESEEGISHDDRRKEKGVEEDE